MSIAATDGAEPALWGFIASYADDVAQIESATAVVSAEAIHDCPDLLDSRREEEKFSPSTILILQNKSANTKNFVDWLNTVKETLGPCGSRKFGPPDYVEDFLPDSHPPVL